jgi:hypothetical protein
LFAEIKKMACKPIPGLKQPIARQDEKASRWFEPLSRSSRDFSVLFLKKLSAGFDTPLPENR